MCVKSTSSVFCGFVTQKSARRANLRQQEIEMACLIIRYCSMYIKVLNHLHCFFAVMNAKESALILKTEPFLLWQWVIQIGPLRSNAQPLICPQFLLEFLWSCFSWQDPSRSSRRKVAAQRLLDFFQTNYHLNRGFPHVFHCLFHPFREQQLGKNNFHLCGQWLLSLKEVYFQMS